MKDEIDDLDKSDDEMEGHGDTNSQHITHLEENDRYQHRLAHDGDSM